MSIVLKFTIEPGVQVIKVQEGSKLIHIGIQGRGERQEARMWFLVPNIQAPIEERTFVVFPTGMVFDGRNREHRGTFLMSDGALVFHVFEEVYPK